MKACAVALLALLHPASAEAAMKVGDHAPDFSIQAAVGGRTFAFHLAEALKQGPVVLYFYPKSFTSICTIEAHDFADNMENFAAAGAAVIGVSADGIEIQKEFSTRECRDKFPVGADPDGTVIRAYDAQMFRVGSFGPSMSGRISYVIAPDGAIVAVTEDSSAAAHIANALAAVRKWRSERQP
jgi:peroxiredoxin